MSNDNVRNEKAKKLSERMIAIIASLSLGLLAVILSLIFIKNDSAFLYILVSLGVGACTFLYATVIAYLAFTFIHKNKSYALIAYIAASLATALLLIVLALAWYYILIVILFFLVLFWLLSITVYSKKLTLVFDNEKPDYKNYEQRKAEKQAEEANKKEEELPKIKSFKD